VSAPNRRRVAIGVVQYGVGLAALAWLLSPVQTARLAEVLAVVEPPVVAALLAVTGLGLVARFYTWKVLVDRIRRTDLATAAGIDLVVNFVNQLLPSRLTGRAAAPLVIRGRTGMGYSEAVAVAGVHTGLYAVLYGVGAAAGLALVVGRLSAGLLVVLAVTTGLYLVAGAFVLLAGTNMGLADRTVGALGRLVGLVPVVGDRLAARVRALPDFTTESAGWFRTLSSEPRVLLPYAAGFAVALVVAPGVRVWLLLDAFGVGFEPAVALPLYLLVAYSVTLLPITPGGIGVSEASATAVFVALGVPAGVVVPVVFVDRFLGVYLPALAGWYPSVGLDVSELVPE